GHLINRSIAISNPLVWIGIIWIRCGVVVPGGHPYHRAFGQYRSRFLSIYIVVHPIEIESVDVAEYLDRAVRQDRFYAHCFSTQVHVRLEVLEARWLFQYDEALSLGDCVRRYVQSSRHRHRIENRQPGSIFGHFALWIQIDSKLDVVSDRLADRMIMDIPADPGAGQQQLAGVGAIGVVVLADRPFHQETGAILPGRFVVARVKAWLVLLELGQRVVSDFASRHRAGPHLDG